MLRDVAFGVCFRLGEAFYRLAVRIDGTPPEPYRHRQPYYGGRI